MSRFTPFLYLCFSLSLSACFDPAIGLEVEVVSEIRDGGRLSTFEFEVLDIQVQPEGFEVRADHQVTDEWVPLNLLVDGFDVRATQSQPQTIAHAEIPVGRYDRIFLRPKSLRATNQDGVDVEIKNVMEPTAISFEMAEGTSLVLRLEIIVLESLDGEEQLSIFAKHVRVID